MSLRPNVTLLTSRWQSLCSQCQRCEIQALKCATDEPYPRSWSFNRSFAKRRQFSTTNRAWALETSSSPSPNAPIDDLPPSSRKTDRGRATKSFGPKRDIRQELRLWTAQNEQRKQEQAPETIPASGRILTLPHSLFMPEPSESDGPEEELDLEAEAVDDWDDVKDTHEVRVKLASGDLTSVQSKHGEKGVLAVYLGELGLSEFYLLQNGRWLFHRMPVYPTLVFPGFASKEEVQSLLEHLPKRPIERELLPGFKKAVSFTGDVIANSSNPVLRRIQALTAEILSYRRDNTDLIDSLYENHAHETDWVIMTFSKFVQKVAGSEASPAAQWALLRAITRETTRVITTAQGPAGEKILLFIPRKLTRDFELVVGWARQYSEAAARASGGTNVDELLRDNPITTFIEKSRRIILESRKFRSPTTTGSLGPSKQRLFAKDGTPQTKPIGEKWSEADKMILLFIWDTYCRRPLTSRVTRHWSTASLILRAIGAYPKMELGRAIGSLFLREVGFSSPWDDVFCNAVHLPFPGSMGSEELDRLRTAAMKHCKELDMLPQTQRTLLPDSFGGIRKDLGDLDVLSIDSLHSSYPEDGVSLEPSVEQPGCHWIHVHVSHPSAFIHRDHLFAQMARAQHTTIYTPSAGRHHLMLPSEFTAERCLKSGAETLTISSLLNDHGEVLDIKIQPTRVNNVIRLQTCAVTQLLGLPTKEMACIVVGPHPGFRPDSSEKPTGETLDRARQYLPTLKKIQDISWSRQLAKRRETPVWLNSWSTDLYVRASTSRLEQVSTSRMHSSHHHLGDPTIKVEVTRHLRIQRASEKREDLVAELMTLAGESAGKWCRDRNLPATFHGLNFHPAFGIATLNKKKQTEEWRKPWPILSPEPLYYAPVNSKQYTRVSSPLRRFTDLITHWNIDAYLRAESEGKIHPGVPRKGDEFPLPWPAQDIQDYINNETWVLSDLKASSVQQSKELIYMALFRAFHFHEAELPAVWDVKIHTKVAHRDGLAGLPESTGILGKVLPFSILAVVLKSEEGWENEVRVGQYLPCKIEIVDGANHCVRMRPVGEPADDYTQLDPISIWSEEGKETQPEDLAERAGTGGVGDS